MFTNNKKFIFENLIAQMYAKFCNEEKIKTQIQTAPFYIAHLHDTHIYLYFI